MKTLDEAWAWYTSTRGQLRLVERLADRYWDALAVLGPLGQDNRLRGLRAADLKAAAGQSLGQLDDLAVVVLFSVFEAQVRQRVGDEVRQEAAALQHPALQGAAAEVLQRIDEGSFFRVLEPFKVQNTNLVEEVNQVRRYRNWVAHGRKGKSPAHVRPGVAYARLDRFLQILLRGPELSSPVE